VFVTTSIVEVTSLITGNIDLKQRTVNGMT